ncbi:MAG TPA: hypothetical protein VK898_22485, partial [Chloroflexota bacterium]|nr:hypothetical protein [Chloroflexota bacterium]
MRALDPRLLRRTRSARPLLAADTGLGIASALAGRLAFGSLLGKSWVMVPIAILLVAMAASMFGAFELALPTDLQTRLSGVGGKGFGGAFLMGLVGGIIAAPCAGPVLAS